MAEFSIINNYFAPLGFTTKYVALEIGDDAAILNIPKDYSLVTAGDTLISGVHFPEEFSAYNMAYRSLATNLSDLAAMGAKPIAYLLQVCFDKNDPEWLASFSEGLKEAAQGIPLIGGDTTKSEKVMISITTYGMIEKGKALKRSTAQVDDDIYVTGILGQGAQGLADYYQHQTTTSAASHFQTPQIPLVFAQALAEKSLVHACIDISDGLDGDLKHILDMSWVGANIQLDALPLVDKALFAAEINIDSNQKDEQTKIPLQTQGDKIVEKSEKNLMKSLAENHSLESLWKMALFGGDDYQLCFTASIKQRENFQLLAEKHDVHLSRIGIITQQTGLIYTCYNEPMTLDGTSYSHFN